MSEDIPGQLERASKAIGQPVADIARAQAGLYRAAEGLTVDSAHISARRDQLVQVARELDKIRVFLLGTKVDMGVQAEMVAKWDEDE